MLFLADLTSTWGSLEKWGGMYERRKGVLHRK